MNQRYYKVDLPSGDCAIYKDGNYIGRTHESHGTTKFTTKRDEGNQFSQNLGLGSADKIVKHLNKEGW